jgi:hypothetical protein
VTDFTWDAASGRYRNSQGRYVSQAAVRDAVDDVLDAATARMQALARRLQSGALDLASWQRQMAQEIKMSHLAVAMVAHGGRAAMGPAEYGWAGQRIREQYGYLRAFARQVASGEQSLADPLVARSALYGQAGRATYEAMRERDDRARGFDEERSVLGIADHCSDCVGEAAKAWSPIGTLIPIGRRQCKANCRCRIERRQDLDEHLRRVQALGPRDVLPLGQLKGSIVAAWGGQADGNLDIVLTGRQRQHYLGRHPDVADLERDIRAAVLRPDEVHRNKSDRDVLLFYRRLDAGHFVRVAVRMQASAGWRKHSIMSYRIARQDEVDRNQARLAWTK